MLQLTPLTSTSHPEERDTRISETRWFLELSHDSAFGLDSIQSEFPRILTPQNHVYLDQLHQEHLLLSLIKIKKILFEMYNYTLKGGKNTSVSSGIWKKQEALIDNYHVIQYHTT